jgi:hypothetical protein
MFETVDEVRILKYLVDVTVFFYQNSVFTRSHRQIVGKR